MQRKMYGKKSKFRSAKLYKANNKHLKLYDKD